MNQSQRAANFAVVEPLRTCCDYYARVLDRAGYLKFLAVGTRRGVKGVREEKTRLYPAVGLIAYAGAKILSPFHAESFRFRLHPLIDRLAKRHLAPGDHVLSSFGYANACFKFAKRTGGTTFLDCGNSHPDNFWTIISEELARWGSPYTPVGRHHYERSLAMLHDTDYFLSPSSFVAESFLTRGFSAERVLRVFYPVDLTDFQPSPASRPKERPLTIISTGSLSIRKGTPYMLEAFDLIHRTHPSARFLLTSQIENNVRPILAKYQHLPIEWSPSLPHPKLAERLRSADVFVLPSLEDGFAVTVAEALACGLPVVTTPNTGASDLVESGKNGEVVPIRDARAIADAVLKWGDRMISGSGSAAVFHCERVSPKRFETLLLQHLQRIGVVGSGQS